MVVIVAALVLLVVPHVAVDVVIVAMVVVVAVLHLPHAQVAQMGVVEVVLVVVVVVVQGDAVQVVVGNAKILLNLQHVLVVAITVALPVLENVKLLVPQLAQAVATGEIVLGNALEVVQAVVVGHVSLHVMTLVTIHVEQPVLEHVKHIVE